MSDSAARNGTAAIASIVDNIDAQYIANVQGDHPLIPPDLIKKLIKELVKIDADVVTPVYRIKRVEDIRNTSVGKVARDLKGKALYFSRSPIPYVVNTDMDNWLKEIPFWGH